MAHEVHGSCLPCSILVGKDCKQNKAKCIGPEWSTFGISKLLNGVKMALFTWSLGFLHISWAGTVIFRMIYDLDVDQISISINGKDQCLVFLYFARNKINKLSSLKDWYPVLRNVFLLQCSSPLIRTNDIFWAITFLGYKSTPTRCILLVHAFRNQSISFLWCSSRVLSLSTSCMPWSLHIFWLETAGEQLISITSWAQHYKWWIHKSNWTMKNCCTRIAVTSM